VHQPQQHRDYNELACMRQLILCAHGLALEEAPRHSCDFVGAFGAGAWHVASAALPGHDPPPDESLCVLPPVPPRPMAPSADCTPTAVPPRSPAGTSPRALPCRRHRSPRKRSWQRAPALRTRPLWTILRLFTPVRDLQQRDRPCHALRRRRRLPSLCIHNEGSLSHSLSG
jgi:hypothetical protein